MVDDDDDDDIIANTSVKSGKWAIVVVVLFFYCDPNVCVRGECDKFYDIKYLREICTIIASKNWELDNFISLQGPYTYITGLNINISSKTCRVSGVRNENL